MKFKVKGFDPEADKFDESVVKIDVWYDRHTRNWVVMKMNKNGDQIGGADFPYTKKEALELKDEYEKEYGLQ